jgi:hypothetical protein
VVRQALVDDFVDVESSKFNNFQHPGQSDLLNLKDFLRVVPLVPNLITALSKNAQDSMTSKLLQVNGLC